MLELMRVRTPERLVRVAVGAGLLAYFAFFPHAYWALLGLVPLLTGLVSACPLYGLLRRRPARTGGSVEAAPAVETGPAAAIEESRAEPAPAPRPDQPLQRARKKMKRQASGRARPASAATPEPGKVGQVTDASFSSLVEAASQPVLVDFWAEWCGPCKAMAPVLGEVAAELGGSARIVKLDVEKNPVTAERLGIRNIPTLILFEGGEVKDVLVGIQGKDKLLRLIRRSVSRAA